MRARRAASAGPRRFGADLATGSILGSGRCSIGIGNRPAGSGARPRGFLGRLSRRGGPGPIRRFGDLSETSNAPVPDRERRSSPCILLPAMPSGLTGAKIALSGAVSSGRRSSPMAASATVASPLSRPVPAKPGRWCRMLSCGRCPSAAGFRVGRSPTIPKRWPRNDGELCLPCQGPGVASTVPGVDEPP